MDKPTKLAESTKPTIPVATSTADIYLKEFLRKVGEEIKYLDEHSESVYNILQSALQDAMRWAPATVMHRQPPSVAELRKLGIQALTICFCTERFERNK